MTFTTHKTLRGPRGGVILAGKDREAEMNKYIFPGIQGGPLMHTIAAKAVAFGEALAPSFKEYSEERDNQRPGPGRDARVARA